MAHFFLDKRNEDGAYVKIASINIKSGDAWGYDGFGHADQLVGMDGLHVDANNVSGKATITLSYKVEKGTYYIAINKVWQDDCNYELTATVKSDKTKAFSYLGITLKKGETMQLEAVDADAKKTTWTSSKKTVATVSSTGKITAKKKGTTIITCKRGDVIVKLKVTVK